MRIIEIISIALVALLLVGCDTSTVSRAEYEAVVSHAQELEAENDSLQFELSSLKIYVECLEEDNDELAEELKHTVQELEK